jgi:hypothetical protein
MSTSLMKVESIGPGKTNTFGFRHVYRCSLFDLDKCFKHVKTLFGVKCFWASETFILIPE